LARSQVYILKGASMKEILIVWAIFVFSVIYWDVNIRYEEKEPLSKCHEAKVKEYKNRYLCSECEKWCEVI